MQIVDHPVRVADLEYRAWVGYYLRDWPGVLRASIGLVRAGFGMDWLRTLHGAWLVLRANQLWAPADNDPDGARRCMRRFYGRRDYIVQELRRIRTFREFAVKARVGARVLAPRVARFMDKALARFGGPSSVPVGGA